MEDLLEKERQGVLAEKNKEELEQNRHWAFLRKLIGEEILEGFESAPPGLSARGINDLAESIAPRLGMTKEEVEKHLEPLLRGGYIYPKRNERGDLRCKWAPN
jgi:DNA-binding transcriptional ArsR family regulator